MPLKLFRCIQELLSGKIHFDYLTENKIKGTIDNMIYIVMGNAIDSVDGNTMDRYNS